MRVARGELLSDETARVASVRLNERAKPHVDEASQWVAAAVKDAPAGESISRKPYYGINTGFGALAGRTTLESEHLTRVLTRNLLESHAVGVREYFDHETVRAAMLLRAHSLGQGYSGIRWEVIERFVAMLNKGIYPAVPRMGSLGASGDLAPLSHLALVISKPPDDRDSPSGEAFQEVSSEIDPSDYHHVTEARLSGARTVWKRIAGSQAMKSVGGQIELRAKEGLALNNGTTFSCALAALTLHDVRNLLRNADLALTMTLEALSGFRDPFLRETLSVRGHAGAQATADAVLGYSRASRLLDGSPEHPPLRVPPQDPYSVRCAPHVHGAVRDALDFIGRTVTTELNAVTDNPLIFLSLPRSYKTVSCGNFHGEPIAFAMDLLGIVTSELGSISERRVFKLTDYATHQDFGLPEFLLEDRKLLGLNSGLMMPQYTAASLVSECKTLAHPDSVDSIPSSANQEDHVSMSLNAALHARQIADNIEWVVAIELLCAAQALEWRMRLSPEVRPGLGTAAALRRLRRDVAYLERDRVLYPDLRAMLRLVRRGTLIEAASAALDNPVS